MTTLGLMIECCWSSEGPWSTLYWGPRAKWATHAHLKYWGNYNHTPVVENARTSSDIVLVISRGLQLPYRRKSHNWLQFVTTNTKMPYVTVDSVWGLLLVSFMVRANRLGSLGSRAIGRGIEHRPER